MMTDALQHNTVWAYNVDGTKDTLTDAATPANTTTFVLDAFGRLSQQLDPPLLNHPPAVFAYDWDGNLTSSTDRNGRLITYAYRSIAATKNICAPRANVNTVW